MKWVLRVEATQIGPACVWLRDEQKPEKRNLVRVCISMWILTERRVVGAPDAALTHAPHNTLGVALSLLRRAEGCVRTNKKREAK
jgi:hypothetical protein